MDIIGKKSLDNRSKLYREEQGSGSMFNGNRNRGRKEESELKKIRIPVQVTKKEKQLIQAIAKSKGYSNVSEYIRIVAIYKPYNDMFGGGSNQYININCRKHNNKYPNYCNVDMG